MGLGLLVSLSGCTICSSPFDYDYGGYVSKTPRTDMRHGRVGSLFSDPSGMSVPSSSSQATLSDDATPTDGIEIPDPEALDD